MQSEIQDAQKWLDVQKEENMYRRDLRKRIELINRVLEEMKKPDIFICDGDMCQSKRPGANNTMLAMVRGYLCRES